VVKRPQQLTPLEWDILLAVLQFTEFPVTVRQVLEKAYPNGEKAYTTVQTVMNHLTEKSYLIRQKMGPLNVYRPNISVQEIRGKEMGRLVEKIFGGSFLSMASYLINSGQLTVEELAELKTLLNQKNKEKGDE